MIRIVWQRYIRQRLCEFWSRDCGRNWGEHVTNTTDGITKQNPFEGGVFGWIRYFCDQTKTCMT